MTSTVVYEKISLWRTAWAEIKTTKDVWWPWVAGFIVLFTAITVITQLIVPVTELDREALKQHPEMILKFFKPLIPSFLIILGLDLGAAYGFATLYLQHAVKNNPPAFSANNFFFWLGKILLKYLRPMPWLLLSPLFGIGLIFYYRSIFRRAIVTPLAILRQEPVLQRSWDLTKDNVWRIIWGYFVLNLVIMLIVLGVALIPAVVWVIATHGDRQSIFYIGGHALFRGVSTGTTTMANAIFSCTVYRVLLREQSATTATAPLNDPTFM
jgi:hypothetical protein